MKIFRSHIFNVPTYRRFPKRIWGAHLEADARFSKEDG